MALEERAPGLEDGIWGSCSVVGNQVMKNMGEAREGRRDLIPELSPPFLGNELLLSDP